MTYPTKYGKTSTVVFVAGGTKAFVRNSR